MQTSQRTRIIFLVALSTIILWFCYLIARPFLTPILFAIVLAIVFYPLHHWLQQYVRNPNAASFFSTLLIVLLILLPALLLGLAIRRELTVLYQALQQQNASEGGLFPQLLRLSENVLGWLARYVDPSQFDLRSEWLNRVQQLLSFLVQKGANFLGDVTSFIVQAVITFFLLFYLLRDGRALCRRLAVFIPLRHEQVEKLMSGVSKTITASMYGGLAVAVAQGLLLSLAFWFLKLPSPILWGVATALFSFIPVVGSGAIWLPASIILLLSGYPVKGLILLGWGAGIVAMADNILRPYVISEQVHFHPLYIFFALLGGLQAFGFIGLFVGPVVLAIAQVLFGLLVEESHWLKNENSSSS